MKKIQYAILFGMVSLLMEINSVCAFTPDQPHMLDYAAVPPQFADTAKPSIMLMVDNSTSMFASAHNSYDTGDDSDGWDCFKHGQNIGRWEGYYYAGGYNLGDHAFVRKMAFNPEHEYYGIFDSKGYYEYDSSKEYFRLVCSGSESSAIKCDETTGTGNDWSGNFLNYNMVNRGDVTKIALTGGIVEEIKVTVDNGDGTTTEKTKTVRSRYSPDHTINLESLYDDSKAVSDINGYIRHMTPYRSAGDAGYFLFMFNNRDYGLRVYPAEETRSRCDDQNGFIYGSNLKKTYTYAGEIITPEESYTPTYTADGNTYECYKVTRSGRSYEWKWRMINGTWYKKPWYYRNYYFYKDGQLGKTQVKGGWSRSDADFDSKPYSGGYCYYTKETGDYDKLVVVTQPAQIGSAGYRYPLQTIPFAGLRAEVEGDVSGVIQDTADKVRYGLSTYRGDSEGGSVLNFVGDSVSSIVEKVNTIKLETSTPLAETLYTLLGYFSQSREYYSWSNGETVLGAKYSGSPTSYEVNRTNDPFYFNGKDDEEGEYAPCSNGYVILLTDGDPTADDSVPAFLEKTTGKYQQTVDGYSDINSSSLDNVTLFAHTRDIRPDLVGTQRLHVYPIYMFGRGESAQELMKKVAVNGTFNDKDGDGKVDLGEWEKKSATNDDPKNYYHATSGTELSTALRELAKGVSAVASKGSASSVTSISSDSDTIGATYIPSYAPTYEPKEAAETTKIKWTGNLETLYVDASGNLREDSNENGQLDLAEDRIAVTYWDDSDPQDKHLKVHTYLDINKNGKLDILLFEDANKNGILDAGEDKNANGVLDVDDEDENANCVLDAGEDDNENGFLDTNETKCNVVTKELSEVKYLWAASDRLNAVSDADIIAQRGEVGQTSDMRYRNISDKRYIFTYIDDNKNGIVDQSEVLNFDTDTLAKDTVTNYFGYFLATNTNNIDKENNPELVDVRDFNGDESVDYEDLQLLINYIRGKDIPNFRSRTYSTITGENGATQTGSVTWRLGDIIQSSPVTVQGASEDYDITYNDKSYRIFKQAMVNRRTMIYVGGNDGMLHAFNGGFLNEEYSLDSTTGEKTPFWKFWASCGENSDNNYILSCSDTATQTNTWVLPVSSTTAGVTTTTYVAVSQNIIPHPVGKEMWAYVPYNLLPHLQWLPQNNYQHIPYVDLTPKVTDVKLWPENDRDHPGGWGTILIGGMRFGGGPVQVNAAAKSVDAEGEEEIGEEGNSQTIDLKTLADKTMKVEDRDDLVLRSGYFVFDITNPEKAPVLLDEFTLENESGVDVSFTTVTPYVAPTVTLSEDKKSYQLTWYLIMGTGPTNLKGESTQDGRVYVRKLDANRTAGIAQYGKSLGDWEPGADTESVLGSNGQPTGDKQNYFSKLGEDKSFMSDPFVADFQVGDPTVNLGAFTTDAIYFGTIAGYFDQREEATDIGKWTGRMHRIVVDSNGRGSMVSTDPRTWKHSIFFNPGLPISARPVVSPDENGNYFVFFGTGRFMNSLDKEDTTPNNVFYGLKEPKTQYYVDRVEESGTIPGYEGSGYQSNVTGKTVTPAVESASNADLSTPLNALDVTNAVVASRGSAAASTVTGVGNGGTSSMSFDYLELLIDGREAGTDGNGNVIPAIEPKDGWYITLDKLGKGNTGERNLTSCAVGGGMLAFNAYSPGIDPCAAAGSSRMFATYAKTGTAYWNPIVEADEGATEENEKNPRTVYLGGGMALAPSLYYSGGSIYIVQEMSKGTSPENDTDNSDKNLSGGGNSGSGSGSGGGSDREVIKTTPPFSVKAGEIFWKNITE